MELAELETLASQIVDWAGNLAAGTARWLALIARFDAAEGHARWECMSCAHWLNWRCGLDLRSAREHVRVARRLEALPLVRAAFEAGEVSYSKVRAITRVAEPDTEAELLMLAAHATAAQLERIVRACVRVGRHADADQAQARRESRQLLMGWGEDGSMLISARLPPEVGAVVREAIEHVERSQPPEVRRSSDLLARRADALATIAAAYLDGASGASTLERYQVVLHVDAAILLNDDRGPDGTAAGGRTAGPGGPPPGPPPPTSLVGEPGRCHLQGGPSLSAETARRLTCDATWVAVIDDEEGRPLAMTARTRRVPPRLRRILNARDQGCRFPGCTYRRAELHHVHHWGRGGPTNATNLVSLCSFHHHRVHEAGWTISGDPTTTIVFHDPSGRPVTDHPAPGGSAEPLAALPVPPGALQCKWAGEPLDLDHITTSLFNRPPTSTP